MHQFYCLIVYCTGNVIKTPVWRNNYPLRNFFEIQRQNKTSRTKNGNQIASLTSKCDADCLHALDKLYLFFVTQKKVPCSKARVVTTTPFYRQFPLSMICQIRAFTILVFWYSMKSVYNKCKMIAEIGFFGKSPETFLLYRKSLFPLWMPKGVFLRRKPKILDTTLLGNLKPALPMKSSSILSSARAQDAPSCGIFYERFENNRNSILLILLYCPGFF